MDAFDDDTVISSDAEKNPQSVFKKKVKRYLPWNIDVLKEQFTSQAYQIELVKLATEKNLLLFQNNDLWKNYIKIMLLKHYELQINKAENKSKKILYITNLTTSLLATNSFLVNHTNNYRIRYSLNSIMLSSLNDTDCMQLKMDANLLLISMQQCNEWFKRGHIDFNEVLFILFDDDLYESLIIQPDQAYTEFISRLNASLVPIHYVGFSRLVINNSTSSKQIDSNLSSIKNLFRNACIETATDLLDTNNLLNNYRPNEIIELYEDFDNKPDCLTIDELIRNECGTHENASSCDQNFLIDRIKTFDKDIDKFGKNLFLIITNALDCLYDMDIVGYKSKEKHESNIDYIHLLCMSVLKECKYLVENVGIWCFGKSLLPFILQLDKLSNLYCPTNVTTTDDPFELLLLEYTSGQLRLLRELCIKQLASFKSIMATQQQRHLNSSLLIRYFCTNKIKCLLKFLKATGQQHENRALCGIIYVTNKQEATTLSLFLKKLSREDASLAHVHPNFIISNSHCDRNVDADNQDHLKQEEIIRKFHSGDINLLVCTYEMEEHLDVPANCNLIIRLDSKYFNYKSYILSKLRLKSKNSTILYVCPMGQFKRFFGIFKNCKNIEHIFETKYSMLTNQFKSLYAFNSDAIGCPHGSQQSFRTRLDYEITERNSLAILNKYCIRLPSDALTQLVPIFDVKQVRVDDTGCVQYKCFLRMPINSALNATIESDLCQRPFDAIRNSAYKANVELYKMNELNDCLEPITKELFFKDVKLKFNLNDDESFYDGPDKRQSQAQQYHRPGDSKRKQIYTKKQSTYLIDSTFDAMHQCYLYVFEVCLTTPIIRDQIDTTRKAFMHKFDEKKFFGLISQKPLIEIPDFTIFTQLGEETVSFRLLKDHFYLSPNQIKLIKLFHRFLFTYVLRMERGPIKFKADSRGAFVCILNDSYDIDWDMIKSVEDFNDKSLLKSNLKDGEVFHFDKDLFENAVVTPHYRANDLQPQFYCVQLVDHEKTPMSEFPSNNANYPSFNDYYTIKYNCKITNTSQPMLIVAHPSTRLNLLTPRYMNLKANVIQKSFVTSNKASGSSVSNNKIYLVPELVNIHPFDVIIWKRSLCLPSLLYRLNSLLCVEELRREIAQATSIGLPWYHGQTFPKLEFLWDRNRETEIFHVPDVEVECMNGVEKDRSIQHSIEIGELDPSSQVSTFEISTWDESIVTKQLSKPTIGLVDASVWNSSSHRTTTTTTNGRYGQDFDNGWFDVSVDNSKTLIIDVNEMGLFEYDDNDDDVSSVWSGANEEIFKSSNLTSQSKLTDFDANDDDDDYEDNDDDNKTTDLASKSVEENSLNNHKFFINLNNLKTDLKRKSAKLLSKLNLNNNDMDNLMSGNFDGNRNDVNNHMQQQQCQTSVFANENPIVHDIQIDLNDTHAVQTNETDNEYPIEFDENDSTWLKRLCLNPNGGHGHECHSIVDLIKYHQTIASKYSEPDVSFDYENIDEYLARRKTEQQPIESNQQTSEHETTGRVDKWAERKRFCHDPLVNDDNNDDNGDCDIGPGPAVLLQALTLSNASDGFDLERLETVGDSFLKQAITVYLYCTYPKVHEGKLSYLRSKQVSNYNLYCLGKKRGLHEIIVSGKFEPLENWLPLHYDTIDNNLTFDQMLSAAIKQSRMKTTMATAATAPIKQNKDFDKYKHHVVSDKAVADCVEAVIGAYLIKSGHLAALRVMYWFGLKVLPKVKLDDGTEVHIDLPNVVEPGSGVGGHSVKLASLLDGYDRFEQTIGYKFRNRAYLLQAFTHASYTYNDITDCYQRLEFLGDAILDYVITRHLYEDPKRHSPGELTDLRSALVNNNIFAYLAVKHEFYKYFKYLSPTIFQIIDTFIKYQQSTNSEFGLDDDFLDYPLMDDDEFMMDDDHVSYGHDDFEELEVPKCLGDIFESVAGAIFLDSNKSFDAVWNVYFVLMRPYIEKYTAKVPKSPIRELLELEPETAKFEKPERTIDGKIRVTVNVIGKGKFKGIGRNYRIAKNAAAKHALKCIRHDNDEV